VTKISESTAVELPIGTTVDVRDFPSADSSLSLVITQVAARNDGRKPAFVATRSVGSWYQIFLPNSSSEGWSSSGWVNGAQQNNALAVLTVGPESARLYANATANNSSTDTFVYGQGLVEPQRLVPFDLSECTPSVVGWYHVFTAQNSSQGDRWIISSAVSCSNGSTQYTLQVNTSGSGTVTSLPSGINCSSNTGTCSYSFTSETNVTLTATPVSGWTFVNWSGACSGSVNTCAVGMTQAQSVTATFSRTQSSHDYNGDRRSDIAWRHSGGTTAAWLLNGAQVTSSGTFGVVPTNWQIVGQRDFNGDSKHDFLWRDASTGIVAIWLLNGLQVLQSGSLGTVPGN